MIERGGALTHICPYTQVGGGGRLKVGYEIIMAMASWFKSRKISDHLYLTNEIYFFEGNRANIWLIKGPSKDVVIDTGLGVNN